MESYIVRKIDGKLEGPYSIRVIKAFVVSGKFGAEDVLVTPEKEIPLKEHNSLQSLWNKKNKTSKSPAKGEGKEAPVKGRVVFYRGKVLPPGPGPTYAGQLTSFSMIRLIYRFSLAQETGRLHLRSGREYVDIFMEKGVPTYAVSNDMQNLLGELLCKEGVLSRAIIDNLLEVSQEEERPLGQILLREKLLPTNKIQEMLTLQFHKRIFSPLGWKEETLYRFYRRQITGCEFPFRFPTLMLLKMGVYDWMPMAQVEAALHPYTNCRVSRLVHPKLKLEDLQLSPAQLKFHNTIGHDAPLHDIIEDTVEEGVLDKETTMRLVYLLWQLELLRMEEEMIGARTQVQIEELDRYMKQLQGQSRLERLGLKGGASPEQIRNAYLKLAKQYHPDHLDPNIHPEISRKKSEAFALIAEAYDVLTS